MTCGCAAEPINDKEYKQYPDSQCKWCPSCNRIFCEIHAAIHQRRLRNKKMRSMTNR